MGIVPRESEHILTNYEKMKFIYPRKELNNLQKLIRKSVATQTVDFTKVLIKEKYLETIILNLLKASIFGIEPETDIHPIYESNSRIGPTKAQILMPINGQQRVTDKVF